MKANPKFSAEQIHVGQEYEAVVVEGLTRTQIVQYAGASGDFNPIHHDEHFATEKAGYPSVFAHGMLTMGLTGKMLTDWLGDGVLTEFGVRFVNQVWPGDTLTAKGRVASVETEDGDAVVKIELTTTNQQGKAVISGSAMARFPSRV